MDRPLLFGKYCLLERISVGGMAEVFRAKPLNAPDPDHYFAVKRILPHLAEDVEFIKMFVDEARLTVQLDHPNIVETYELGQFQSSHYIVMEFIAGKDLLAFQKHVRNQGTILDVEMACHIIREVARGLNYAHNKTDDSGDHLGIIHRDVSPQNVLVSWDGRVRIIDFGIAKAASQTTKTKAGVMKGKFGYMSPEQVQGEEIDHRSDIFAMGTMLWELLTNQRLFKAGNQLEAMTMIGEPDVEPPSRINDEVPAQVDAIVMKMLAEDPNERYHWGEELAADIDEYLESKNPPFHPSQLTTWVRNAFREDFNEEKQKRQKFRQINTAEDVQRQFDGSEESVDEPHEKPDEGEATELWDVDEAPDSDADLENFVSDHTVVQAGGLDESDFEEWDDAPDTIDETEEVVESRARPEASSPAPSPKVEISESSKHRGPESEADYTGEKTVITNPDSSGSVSRPSSGPSRSASGAPGASASTTGQPGGRSTDRGDVSKKPARSSTDDQPTGGPRDQSATAQVTPPSSQTGSGAPTGGRREDSANAGAEAGSLAGDLPDPPSSKSGEGPSGEEGTVTAGSMTAAPTPPGGLTRAGDSETESTGAPSLSLPSLPKLDALNVDLRKGGVAAAAITAVAILGAAAWVTVAGEEEETVATGGLLVEVEPVGTDLEVFVDGDWVGDSDPLALREFEPGDYTVEIDHPDYPFWREEVTVSPDEVATVDVDLEASGQLVVRWEDETSMAGLYVDGQPVDVEEEEESVDLELARQTYLVEAFAPGGRPVREVVEVEGDSVTELDLESTPVDHLTLRGDEETEVRLDGEVRAEELPVVLTELDLDRVYTLEIGDQGAALGFPAIGPGEMSADRLAEHEGLETGDYGRVVMDVDFDEPWHLFVDDVETGLVTSVEELEELPVVAGTRTLGFERGDVRYEFEVRVVEDEPTYFRGRPGR